MLAGGNFEVATSWDLARDCWVLKRIEKAAQDAPIAVTSHFDVQVWCFSHSSAVVLREVVPLSTCCSRRVGYGAPVGAIIVEARTERAGI